MINFNDPIYLDNKHRMFSKPGKDREFVGYHTFKKIKSFKEGATLQIAITQKGIEEVERLLKEKTSME